MIRILGIATISLLTATDLASPQERFSLSGDKVAIYNVAGEVQVNAGTGGNVVVEVTRGGADSERLAIDRKSESGWQIFVVRYPDNRIVYRRLGRLSRTEFNIRDDGMFGRRNLDPDLGAERIKKGQGNLAGDHRIRVAGSGRGLEAYADLRVLVPSGKSVALHLGVGKINVMNVNGDLQLDAASASVHADGVTGFARIDTGSGSITLRNATGDFGLHTGSGGVRLEHVRRGAVVVHTGSGSVEATNLDLNEMMIGTGSGGIQLLNANAPAARISTGSGSIRAQRFGASNFDLETGSGGIRVELTRDIDIGRIGTGSGSVDVIAAPDAGAEVTFDTGSGGITVDGRGLVVHESKRSFLRGRLGDGHGTLRVHTGSGGIFFRSY